MQTKNYEKISETLITEQLPNGLKINIIPRPEFTKCYAMFATNYGGADRRFQLSGKWIDTPAGVAHFLEHKMFDMPYGNALNILSANGANPNAFTSTGITAYYFDSSDMFYENLKVLLEFVSTPHFSAESVEKEQGIIGQEIRMVEDHPGHVVYYNLLKCLYENNPIRDSVAGTVESIAQITDETLYNCHKVFYNPSNMALSVVGNVDPEKVIKMAKEILPPDAGELPLRDYGEKEALIPHCKEISVSMEVSAPQFLFGCVLNRVESGSARRRQMLTGEIALRVLMGRSSEFYTKLYSEGLLNNSFDFELDYTSGTAMMLAGGESRDVRSVMNALNQHVEKLLTGGITSEAFANAKKAQYGSELRGLGSFSAISLALIDGNFAGYNPLDIYEVIDTITIEDIRSFIAENLSKEKLALSVINPASADAG